MGEVAASMTPSRFGIEDRVIIVRVGAWVWNLLPPLWTLPFNSPLPDSSVRKESTCNAGERSWFISWVRKIHWRRDWLPTPVFLGFLFGSAGKESTCNAGDLGSILGLGRSPGEGKGYPLQYSGLENSMNCIVHRVAKSWRQLSNFHFHFPSAASLTCLAGRRRMSICLSIHPRLGLCSLAPLLQSLWVIFPHTFPLWTLRSKNPASTAVHPYLSLEEC